MVAVDLMFESSIYHYFLWKEKKALEEERLAHRLIWESTKASQSKATTTVTTSVAASIQPSSTIPEPQEPSLTQFSVISHGDKADEEYNNSDALPPITMKDNDGNDDGNVASAFDEMEVVLDNDHDLTHATSNEDQALIIEKLISSAESDPVNQDENVPNQTDDAVNDNNRGAINQATTTEPSKEATACSPFSTKYRRIIDVIGTEFPQIASLFNQEVKVALQLSSTPLLSPSSSCASTSSSTSSSTRSSPPPPPPMFYQFFLRHYRKHHRRQGLRTTVADRHTATARIARKRQRKHKKIEDHSNNNNDGVYYPSYRNRTSRKHDKSSSSSTSSSDEHSSDDEGMGNHRSNDDNRQTTQIVASHCDGNTNQVDLGNRGDDPISSSASGSGGGSENNEPDDNERDSKNLTKIIPPVDRHLDDDELDRNETNGEMPLDTKNNDAGNDTEDDDICILNLVDNYQKSNKRSGSTIRKSTTGSPSKNRHDIESDNDSTNIIVNDKQVKPSWDDVKRGKNKRKRVQDSDYDDDDYDDDDDDDDNENILSLVSDMKKNKDAKHKRRSRHSSSSSSSSDDESVRFDSDNRGERHRKPHGKKKNHHVNSKTSFTDYYQRLELYLVKYGSYDHPAISDDRSLLKWMNAIRRNYLLYLVHPPKPIQDKQGDDDDDTQHDPIEPKADVLNLKRINLLNRIHFPWKGHVSGIDNKAGTSLSVMHNNNNIPSFASLNMIDQRSMLQHHPQASHSFYQNYFMNPQQHPFTGFRHPSLLASYTSILPKERSDMPTNVNEEKKMEEMKKPRKYKIRAKQAPSDGRIHQLIRKDPHTGKYDHKTQSFPYVEQKYIYLKCSMCRQQCRTYCLCNPANAVCKRCYASHMQLVKTQANA